jgi:lipopolysaccharide export system protein LptA
VRRRILEIAIALFGAAFLTVVAFSFRSGGRNRNRAASVPKIPAPREAGPALTLSSGFDFTETLKGKPLFHIKADRAAGFGGASPGGGSGSPQLYSGESVSLTLYPDHGEPVTVHSERAEYDAPSQNATLEGNVRWTDEKGALAETEKVFFRSANRRLDLPVPIHFVRAGFDLKARSGTYDLASRTLKLDGPVEGSGTGEKSAGALSTLRADRAVYFRDEGTIQLEGNVRTSSGEGDTLEAERLDLKLAEPENRLAWARASGSVHGTVAAARIGTQGSAARGRPRPYAGNDAAFFFDPNGALQSLTLTGSPASTEEEARSITAKRIEVGFSEGRASSARARGDVEITSGSDRAFADAADLGFDAAGEVQTLELAGNARLAGENRSARADKATQVASRGVWILTGSGASSASVEQEGSRISGPRIEIDDAHHTVRGEGGGIRAVLAPAKEKRAGGAILGDPTRPTFGKADRMLLDQSARTAVLSGSAALWQDASSIFGRDITLNDAERTLVATGDVRGTLAGNPGAPKPEERLPTVVTARRLIYQDPAGAAPGSASLDGGVTAVRGPWRATGSTGKLRFGADGKLDRLELEGAVNLADSSAGRTGQADHAVDLPAEGKTVLDGCPARVIDRDGSRVAGAILTITERGRRVEVTAPEGGKTETIHTTRRDR